MKASRAMCCRPQAWQLWRRACCWGQRSQASGADEAAEALSAGSAESALIGQPVSPTRWPKQPRRLDVRSFSVKTGAGACPEVQRRHAHPHP